MSRLALISVALVLLLPQVAAADGWDGPDKRKHFVAGAGVAANGSLLANVFELDRDERALVGFGLGLVAGATKEGLDALGLGTPSGPDFVWTAAGAFVGAGLTWLLSLVLGDDHDARRDDP